MAFIVENTLFDTQSFLEAWKGLWTLDQVPPSRPPPGEMQMWPFHWADCRGERHRTRRNQAVHLLQCLNAHGLPFPLNLSFQIQKASKQGPSTSPDLAETNGLAVVDLKPLVDTLPVWILSFRPHQIPRPRRFGCLLRIRHRLPHHRIAKILFNLQSRQLPPDDVHRVHTPGHHLGSRRRM